MLPKVERKYTKINVYGKSYDIRPYRTKEEKEYLIAKEINPETSLIDYILKPCVKQNIENLSQIEEVLLLIEIRKISIGNEFEIEFECEKCGNMSFGNISLSDTVSYEKGKYKDIEIDGVKLYIKENNTKSVKKRLNEADTTTEQEFISLIASIYKIEVDGKVYDDFTFKEMCDWFDEQDVTFTKKVIELFSQMSPKLKLEYDVPCLTCGENYSSIITGTDDFFFT